MFVIWHDGDYDLARWVYLNSSLRTEDTILRPIPQNNTRETILHSLTGLNDHHILPLIKYDTPDIIVQEIEEPTQDSRIIFVTEFMTHTPQHHHPLQRFSRIYGASAEKVPVALLIPETKIKLERRDKEYRPASYRTNPLIYHIFLKTARINHTPTLLFWWPDYQGYLKYDKQHPSAPYISEQVEKWIQFLNISIGTNRGKIIEMPVVLEQCELMANTSKYVPLSHQDLMEQWKKLYKLETIRIVSTLEIVKEFSLDYGHLSDRFKRNKLSLVFEPRGLHSPSSPFRTDPYAGMLCAFDNLFCREANGIRSVNLVLRAKNIKYKVSQNRNVFIDLNHNKEQCPFLHKVTRKIAVDHLEVNECPFTRTKQQRIYGAISDIVVFEDSVYYNEHN